MTDDTARITVGEEAESGETVSLPVIDVLAGRGFITGKSGAGKSILEGTPVYTEDGRKPIEEVEEGEKVLSLNKRDYQQEFREVQATIQHTDDRLLRITLKDGTELVGTEDHSFLTADGLEITPVRGTEVEEGTWMPLSRELPSSESVTEIDLAEYLGEANNIKLDGGVIQSGPRTEERRFVLDFEAGKEIGLYLAEGSFDSHQTIQITNIDDGVKQFLDSRGYNVYERTCNKGFQPYARFLESEFGRGSASKSVPNWLFDTPKEFRAGVLSGYFDGDGTIGDDGASMLSKSESLVAGIKELLRQFGVSTTVREKFTLYDGEKRRFQNVRIDSFSIETFAEIVDLSVEHKSEALSELCERLSTGGRYNSKDMIPDFGSVLNTAARNAGWTTRENEKRVAGASVHHLTRKQKAGRRTYNRFVEELGIEGRAKAFGESDIQWKRVVEVEELDGEQIVYDLDVELNDNFVANGVFVHNSNTASIVAEQLLEAGYGLLIVDVDGEYYGLKEEYELLHAGADEECDIRVSPEHAEKLATLALEENVPIILDVSSYLDTEAADEMLLAVARQLFAKAKKQKKPFLVLVEECHEYIPEGGGMTETGKMLIKIGKRGRKHGLGIVGMSQRPADVKKDFITQCDWMVWHRLTWDNDTRVVGRILGSSYADRVEDLGDGEAFLDADWNEDVLRVQFDRKRTFDAGATPGLEEFERPELQSVSEDLVADLEQVSEERERHESEVAALEAELEEKERRIEELEAELAEARDMSEMADRFAQALVENAESSPPENAPAEPEVAEAEEFVADAARDGYPGDEPMPGAETHLADAVGVEDVAGADDGEEPVGEPSATELRSEDQRELHDYEQEVAAEPDEPDESEAEEPQRDEPDADSASPEAPDVADSDESVTVDSGDDEPSPGSEEEDSTTHAAEESTDDTETPAAEGAETKTSGLQPVKTVSSGSRSPDEDAVETADDAAEDAPRDTIADEDAAEKAPTDAAADGDTGDETEVQILTDEGTVGDEAAGENDSVSTESNRATDRTTIQATGGWPEAGDTEQAAEPDPDLTPAPETGAETPEELEQRLSDEFGVTMETGSDLTGGSLGSSGNGESSATAASASAEEPATEPEERDESESVDEPDDADNADESDQRGNGEPDSGEDADEEPDDQPEEGVIDPTADRGARLTELVEQPELCDGAEVVHAFVHGIEALDGVTRGMLEHYQSGDDSPLEAHVAAGGSGERQYAYARNRTLRKAGLVEHVGSGRYRYRLPELVAEAFDARIDEGTLSDTVSAIEAATGLSES